MEQFSEAARFSLQKKKENAIQQQNNNKLNFIEEYYNSNGNVTEELAQIAKEYILHKKGITVGASNGYTVDVNSDSIKGIYSEINQKAKDNFIEHYGNYVYRSENKYYEEAVKEALDNSITAYTTLRQCQQQGKWQKPPVRIMMDEMANLYKLSKSTNDFPAQEDLIK